MGERDRKRREREQRKAFIRCLCRYSPFFRTVGILYFFLYVTLTSQVEGDCGKRLPGSPVLFSRGKLWYRAHTQSLWRDFQTARVQKLHWAVWMGTRDSHFCKLQQPDTKASKDFYLHFPSACSLCKAAFIPRSPDTISNREYIRGWAASFFMCGWTSQESKRPNLSASAAVIIMPLCKAANKCFTGSHQGAYFSTALAG